MDRRQRGRPGIRRQAMVTPPGMVKLELGQGHHPSPLLRCGLYLLLLLTSTPIFEPVSQEKASDSDELSQVPAHQQCQKRVEAGYGASTPALLLWVGVLESPSRQGHTPSAQGQPPREIGALWEEGSMLSSQNKKLHDSKNNLHRALQFSKSGKQ